MNITFDPGKRDKTKVERGMDFADAALVFAGRTLTMLEERRAYPEPRYVTVGFLDGRMVLVVWTPTEDGRRIISMRKTNAREQKHYAQSLG